MNVALISCRRDSLAALEEGLARKGFQIEFFGEAGALFQAAQRRKWDLLVLDGLSLPFQEPVRELLKINAGLNMAVISDLDPRSFQDAAEGLGLLGALPADPGILDADGLWSRLQAVGGIDPVIEAAQASLDARGLQHRQECAVCGEQHPFGLKMDYRANGAHTVVGRYDGSHPHPGGSDFLQGGIISSLLNGAMASCLLAKGLEAHTVDLRVHCQTAVEKGVPALVHGAWLRQEGPLHLLQATLEQGGRVCALAHAQFQEGRPDPPGPGQERAGLAR